MEYSERPFKKFDYIFPLYCLRYDQYFFTPDEIEDFINDFEDDEGNESTPQFQFMLCAPNYLKEIDFNDIWCDLLLENFDSIRDFASKDLLSAMGAINKAIREHPPVTWSCSKYRTNYQQNSPAD